MESLLPPLKAYSVSHQTQRSGQPVRRTKTVGRPTREVSPCKEKKISLIFSEIGFTRSVTGLLLFQALPGCCRRRAIRIFDEHCFKRAFGVFCITLLLLAGSDIDHRIRRFGMIRPFCYNDLL